MKAEYRDSGKPGYGEIVFSECMLPEKPWEISIQRASDKKYLTGDPKNPWVNEVFFISTQGRDGENNSLVIDAGPDLVDQLDPQITHRIRLRGNGGEPLMATLQIPSITYSREANLDNTADVVEKKTPETPKTETPGPVPPKPEQPRQEPPKPQPPLQAPPEESAARQTPQPEQSQAPENGPERLELENGVPDKSRKYWRWVILAVLILGCIAWYVFDPRFREEPQKAVEETSQNAQQLSLEARINEFFRNPGRTAAGAMELAGKAKPATADEKDAIYRLYYYAAENGDKAALLPYGECIDPSTSQWGTIQKDAPAAFKAYQESGDPQKADAAIKRLRDWLEAQARAGNRQAGAWLKEIEQ